jgi:hypothetical protein
VQLGVRINILCLQVVNHYHTAIRVPRDPVSCAIDFLRLDEVRCFFNAYVWFRDISGQRYIALGDQDLGIEGQLEKRLSRASLKVGCKRGAYHSLAVAKGVVN